MRFIQRPHTDPYFNIAAEEYLLRTVDEDCFMLWVSEPSVIIGKHQNAFAEIDQEYIRENGIPVIRRISGGGTVFHDPGNLNFTFIARGENGYCPHHDEKTRRCLIWDDRPLRCRRYDCRKESSFWEDADRGSVRPGTFDHLPERER